MNENQNNAAHLIQDGYLFYNFTLFYSLEEHLSTNLFELFALNKISTSLQIAQEITESLVKKVEASKMLDELFMTYTTPFAIQSYFKQLNTAFNVNGFGHDRGEVPASQREIIKHQWDDGNELVITLFIFSLGLTCHRYLCCPHSFSN